VNTSIRRWQRRLSAPVAVVVAVTVVSAAGLPHAGAATDWAWNQGPVTTVYDPSDASIAGNANVSSFTVPGSSQSSVMFSWTTNDDVGSAGPTTRYKRSTDGGQTFPAGAGTASDTSFGTVARLKSGGLIDVGFIPISVADSDTVNLRVKRSSDNGATWTPISSTLSLNSGWHFSTFNRGLRVNPNILVDTAGHLYLTYYTTLQGESGNRVEMATSTNDGVTWTRLAPIKQPTSTLQYNETGVTWAKPASAGATPEMVAVITEDELVPGTTWRRTVKLITARSSDLGHTWTGQRALPISFDAGYSIRPGPDGQTRFGVSPDVELLPDGIMALRWGRPDNWFAISTDNGQSFKHARRTYVNWPSSGSVWHGSSGNGSMAVVGTNTVVISGDNCAPSWGCPSTDSGWTTNGTYFVWRKIITLIPPG
jgi:hypothetical protein